ncbi:hypothetical protein LTR78_006462 [Recurvomyces mirabilis]|uniref:Uncharacterized protein n=1 Tax=Recurvomyces mirabilis TaxID=574656 RepID=A0AAE0WKU5_9PEZI|nr:hypothetical protein LTR78_006462 [Recurvomyces mirabilis]KAK5151118.1 hypothetical protein LTS14_009614 [Recurvomyces mirabilis]
MSFFLRLSLFLAFIIAFVLVLQSRSVDLTPLPTEMSQYDEDEIISLITNLYFVLIRLGHYEDNEIRFAPPGGFAIDPSQAGNFSPISAPAQSLMRRLPHAPSHKAIGMAMRPVNYDEPEELARSRDIDKLSYNHPHHRDGWARPSMILLAEGQDDIHPQVVLDTADGTIHEIGDELDDGDNRQEVDSQGGDLLDRYLNWPRVDAQVYLRRMT